MFRPSPGTTNARMLTGSWVPWLSRMVKEMMPVPMPWRVCFPAVVISRGVDRVLNSRIRVLRSGMSSSSRKDSDAPLSTSKVAPLALGVKRPGIPAAYMKPPSKSSLLPAKLMTGLPLWDGSVLSTVGSLLSAEVQCLQFVHARDTLAFLVGRVAPWL